MNQENLSEDKLNLIREVLLYSISLNRHLYYDGNAYKLRLNSQYICHNKDMNNNSYEENLMSKMYFNKLSPYFTNEEDVISINNELHINELKLISYVSKPDDWGIKTINLHFSIQISNLYEFINHYNLDFNLFKEQIEYLVNIINSEEKKLIDKLNNYKSVINQINMPLEFF